MRISDWSSDVCSSDLANERLRPIAQSAPRIRIALHGQSTEVGPFVVGVAEGVGNCGCRYIEHGPCDSFKLYARGADRQSVVWGKSVSGRVDSGCTRILEKRYRQI